MRGDELSADVHRMSDFHRVRRGEEEADCHPQAGADEVSQLKLGHLIHSSMRIAKLNVPVWYDIHPSSFIVTVSRVVSSIGNLYNVMSRDRKLADHKQPESECKQHPVVVTCTTSRRWAEE